MDCLCNTCFPYLFLILFFDIFFFWCFLATFHTSAGFYKSIDLTYLSLVFDESKTTLTIFLFDKFFTSAATSRKKGLVCARYLKPTITQEQRQQYGETKPQQGNT